MEQDEESVVAAAVEIADPRARAEFLDRVCGGNEALRREVESLLAAYDVGTRLESPALFADAHATAGYRSPAEEVGGCVGPYRLMEQIGEGGMGLVFVAEQTAPVRRRVALKLIKPGMDSKQVLARFEAERQALALMEHPNIARVLDAGTTEQGRPYFVMELVRGDRITTHCDAHRLTLRERLGVFGQVCRAVQHAHQKGVIHRDIKPSNVLVAVHDVALVAKVIDFGIAKAIGPALTDKTVYTGLAQLVGTPLYMSPEQAGESSLDVDTRTDVYSLGVLLYELLTGSTPIDPEALKGVGHDAVRRVIREDDPPRPSARVSTLAAAARTTLADTRRADPRRLSDMLRGELDWVVMKCLEKDRERRYESPAALAADLDRFLADRPVEARPPSGVYRLRKFARRNRAALATAAVVLGVAAVAAPVVFWQAADAASARSQADEQARNTRRQREETERLVAHTLEHEVAAHRDAKDWFRAQEGLKRGVALLGSVGGSEELQSTVRGQLRDVRMAATLRDLSLQAAVKGDTIDRSRGIDDYRRAFREFGVDVEALPAEEAGRLLGGRTIPAELAAALMDWAVIRSGIAPRETAAPLVRHLVAVAQAADPDAGRVKIREAVVMLDVDAMATLAASDQVDTLPPTTLGLLGMALRDMGRPGESVALFTRGQQKHPGDFWLNVELGRTLTASIPLATTSTSGTTGRPLPSRRTAGWPTSSWATPSTSAAT
jgi:serine/threonine protein kinase